MARLGWGWAIIIILVLAILAGGGLYLARRGGSSPPLEIVLSPTPNRQIEVHVDGAVNDPGLYNLPEDTSLERLLQAAGGLKDGGEANRVEIYVPELGQTPSPAPQKVNLNTAPAWLLEALPDIGPALSQSIIEYRDQHRFERISQLMQVEGISPTIYERLKDLVTVE
jgi:competence protein ComEA